MIFQLLKQSSAAKVGDSFSYSNLGHFSVRLGDDQTDRRWFVYDPEFQHILLRVEDHRVPDRDPLSSHVYSLVDFMPGAVAEAGQLFLTEFYHVLGEASFDQRDAVVLMTGFNDASWAGRVQIRFPYAIEISVGKPYSVECEKGGYLARLMPSSPDAPQNVSGLGVPARDLSDSNQALLCRALIPTDYHALN